MMIARHTVRILGALPVAGALLVGSLLGTPGEPTSASAEGCPDVEVVYARGSGQPTGLGDIGEAFVEALKTRVTDRSLTVYPVNYPASHDYRTSSAAGEKDATAHILGTVTNCPDTKVVMGGYSQGATVMEMASNSMPADVLDHVAAVVLFGTPAGPYSTGLMGSELPVIAPAYAPKTLSMCLADDLFCNEGGNIVQHLMYISAGKAEEGANFVAERLGDSGSESGPKAGSKPDSKSDTAPSQQAATTSG